MNQNHSTESRMATTPRGQGIAAPRSPDRSASDLAPTIYCPPTRVEQCVESDRRSRGLA